MSEVKSGYLLIYGSDGDEVHVDLITEEHYNKIVSALAIGKSKDVRAALEAAEKAAFETGAIQTWFTQTYCNEPWPYNDIKILGTVSVACY